MGCIELDKAIIHLKDVISEDFINYKYPSMFLATANCNWKCCIENNLPITTCQNQPLVVRTTHQFYIEDIIDSYLSNEITKAVVFGGLEPFMQPTEVIDFIERFREKCDDDIVIYTGYYKEEIRVIINELKRYKNIVVKFGRYVPNHKPHYDEILGVNLVSGNQYAERIS